MANGSKSGRSRRSEKKVFPNFMILMAFPCLSFSLQELQFQEQQEELQRELQQRSTQQLLEASSYYDSNDTTAKQHVDFDYYRRVYEKQPQLITNLNNLNYQASNSNQQQPIQQQQQPQQQQQQQHNTINQSSAKDILYELKQYEHFANNAINGYVAAERRDQNQISNTGQLNGGTNYSQNILNYNNSYYRINNINNYNYIKNQSPAASSYREHNQRQQQQQQHDKYLLNDKMERDELPATLVESKQLVNKFDVNNIASHHTTLPVQLPPAKTTMTSSHQHNSSNNMDDDEEQRQQNTAPIYRSQHITQVMNFISNNDELKSTL